MTEARILFVCTQNVCRSPYLAARLADDLEDTTSVSVFSRGTDVREWASICENARWLLDSLAVRRQHYAGHRSRRLSVADIADADLILTAGTMHRSAVARLDPAARSRTFTVREALLLSGTEVDGQPRSVNRFAEVLNMRRGTMDPPKVPKRLFRRGSARDPESALDIPDGHAQGRAIHERIFPEMDADVERLGTRLKTFLAG